MWRVLTLFADEAGGGSECVQTALFGGEYCGGIWGVIGIALDVMTYGVAAAAVVGVVIAGIQYMTSSGDPGQMTKAKRRLIEIGIGLVAYGLLYAFMQWLIPGGVF